MTGQGTRLLVRRGATGLYFRDGAIKITGSFCVVCGINLFMVQ